PDHPRPDEPGPVARTGAVGARWGAGVGGPRDGPPVGRLHGGGKPRHSWHGTWRVLADAGWRAVSLDLRGHGDSQWSPDGDYSLDVLSADVAAVVASLPAPPTLVGPSLCRLASLVALAAT